MRGPGTITAAHVRRTALVAMTALWGSSCGWNLNTRHGTWIHRGGYEIIHREGADHLHNQPNNKLCAAFDNPSPPGPYVRDPKDFDEHALLAASSGTPSRHPKGHQRALDQVMIKAEGESGMRRTLVHLLELMRVRRK